MTANGEDGRPIEIGPQDEGEPLLPAGGLKTLTDVRRLHLEMTNVQRNRVSRALNAERLQGPAVDKSTSTEVRRLNSMIAAYHQFFEPEKEKPEKSAGLIEGMLACVFEPKPERSKTFLIRLAAVF